ncbi:MAG: hydroxyacylglutathione hydrolase, partial [Acetobacteraceae bacterium]
MTVTAQSVPILKDNYAWLLKDSGTGATAIVDPAEAGPIIAAIEAAGGRLDMILLTHHHGDHIADTDVIRAKYKCPVVGAAADAHRLPKLDQAVKEGDTVTLGSAKARVIETPGHTRGQINFFFPDGPILLSGDTLFSLGCGRLIEGTAQEMFTSLAKLKALPGDTQVCCGHEYTESNARFALHVDPGNADLKAMSNKVT